MKVLSRCECTVHYLIHTRAHTHRPTGATNHYIRDSDSKWVGRGGGVERFINCQLFYAQQSTAWVRQNQLIANISIYIFTLVSGLKLYCRVFISFLNTTTTEEIYTVVYCTPYDYRRRQFFLMYSTNCFLVILVRLKNIWTK